MTAAPTLPRVAAMPRLARIKQRFAGPRLDDVAAATRASLAALDLPVRPGQSVALTAGSRGIVNIDVILRACVEHLAALGARPFIVPAMGSHGGATAEGQLAVLAHYGITEASMGCPLRATMEVVPIGEALGLPVWLDRHAAEADWIGVVNRVKPHTDFKGEVESGLTKMMAIGLANHRGTIQAHRAAVHHGYEKVFASVARTVLGSAPILFGLGVVENGYDETALVRAVLADDIEVSERAWLRQAKTWLARLPVDRIDVLIVDEMGKDISGAGMDANVIGRHGTFFEPPFPTPRITFIVVCDLTPNSHGNATGIGSANFTTRRLADKIDWSATYMNVLTANAPDYARLPPALATDEEAIGVALGCLGGDGADSLRVVRIKNTLRLTEIDVSASLLPELDGRDDVAVVGAPVALAFDAAGTLEPF